MKTLLERLKPEVRAKLDKGKNDFPHLYESVVKSLEENFYFTDLTLGEFTNFSVVSDIYEIIDFYESFE